MSGSTGSESLAVGIRDLDVAFATDGGEPQRSDGFMPWVPPSSSQYQRPSGALMTSVVSPFELAEMISGSDPAE